MEVVFGKLRPVLNSEMPPVGATFMEAHRFILLSMRVFIASCGGQPAPVQAGGVDCERPTDVVLTDSELKLAGIEIGKASVGNIEFKNDKKLEQLLSDSNRTALVSDYLICVAEKRGEIDKRDTAGVQYLRALFTFTYASQSRPTSAEISSWIDAHLPNSAPNGRPPYRAGGSDIDPQNETCLSPAVSANTPVCVSMHGDWANGFGPLGHNRLGAVSVLTRRADSTAAVLSSSQIYLHSNWFQEPVAYQVCVVPPGDAKRTNDVGDRMSVDAIERSKEQCPQVDVRP